MDGQVSSTEGMFPVKQSQGAAIIGGEHTDIVVVDFGNRLCLVLTQYQKLGSLLHCHTDGVLQDGERGRTHSIQTLLGDENEEMVLLARILTDRLYSSGMAKPILLSLALKTYDSDHIASVLDLVFQHKIW